MRGFWSPAPLAALALCACSQPGAPQLAPPTGHVVLIVIDTLRADRVGAFGGPADVTHGIDELARKGVRFERAVAQSSWTAPSMISLFTARYLAERRMSIPEEAPTIAELFQARGYTTAAFVTNPLVNERNGFARGFDEFTTLRKPHGDERIAEWFHVRAGRPTFTFLHLSEPHDPYTPPERLVKRARVPLDESTRRALEDEGARLGLEHIEDSLAAIERQLARYEGEVRWTDHAVSEVLIALDQAGDLDGACVALTADHGEGLWTRRDLQPFIDQRLAKGEPAALETLFKQRHGAQLHEELIRVPLILMAPELPSGLTVEALVENVDLTPTLLELAGIDAPQGIDGLSLLRAMREPATWSKREAFSMTRYARSLTTTQGMKLIQPTEFGARHADLAPELYDLMADPSERRNLAAAQPDLVHTLSARIEAIAADACGAAFPDVQVEVEDNLEALRQLGYVDDDESPR